MAENTAKNIYIWTKNWIEINEDSLGTHNTNSQFKFKSLILKTSLCECSNRYILVKELISVVGIGANSAAKKTCRKNKDIILKNWAPFTDYISKINSTHLNTAKNIDVVIPMSKLMRYSDRYSKASEILYQFCRY